LSIEQKHTSNSDNSLPKQRFLGHQEFFALFLNAGDSYRFNTHLKRRLAQLVIEMTAVTDIKGLCQHITKTMMLAKFLGLLVFSPNWSITEGGSLEAKAEVIPLSNHEAPPIDLKEQIQKAWREYRLVIVIPWVVEFLKMATW
jgi:hypothetical protein